jgi:RNA polymerase sigma factor (sigma-70 family)
LTVTGTVDTLAHTGLAARRFVARPCLRPSAVPDAPDPISPALDALLARFAGMLRHIALRRGVPEDEIADVLQNLRLRLWRAHGEADAISGLGSSYIYRAGISAALDVIRERRARRNQTSLEEIADDPVAPDSADPAERLERSEEAQAVAAAIRTLAESRRVPVRMYLSGYTRDEIAQHLRWSEAKTRNLLYRGLDDLREELRRRGIGPGGTEW